MSELASHWSLDPEMVFLNHGSFGATPLVVQAAQDAIRARMESEPVRFFVEDLFPLLDAMRRSLALLLDAPWDEFAPITNATHGVTTALEHCALRPGDEILVNDHEYPACLNNARRIASRAGASVVSVTLPWPLTTDNPDDPAAAREAEDQIVRAVLAGVTPRTRVALLSHVTSPSALVLPVARLVRELRARGVRSLIDGAHAPGMIEGLSLRQIDADYYTANCHKWICSPKGSAFLHVRREHLSTFRPLVLSNNAEVPRAGREQFLTEFDYLGTADPSALIAIPAAVAFIRGVLPGGEREVMRRNRDMVLRARRMICEGLGTAPLAPAGLIGSIASIRLPPRPQAAEASQRPIERRYFDPLQERLIDRWKIQVPVWAVPGTTLRLMRISSQLYNTDAQYAYLLKAVREELRREGAA